ncbi:MAG: hypothetical protein ACLTEH_00215 [Clostridia bacterium]
MDGNVCLAAHNRGMDMASSGNRLLQKGIEFTKQKKEEELMK